MNPIRKGLAVAVITLLVGLCLVPNVNSVLLKKDKLSDFQIANSDLCTHLDREVYDITLCTFFPGEFDDAFRKISGKRHILAGTHELQKKNTIIKTKDFLRRLRHL